VNAFRKTEIIIAKPISIRDMYLLVEVSLSISPRRGQSLVTRQRNIDVGRHTVIGVSCGRAVCAIEVADRAAVKCIQARLPPYRSSRTSSRRRWRTAKTLPFSLEEDTPAHFAVGRRWKPTARRFVVVGAALSEDSFVFVVPAVASLRGVSATPRVHMVVVPLEPFADVHVPVAITLALTVMLKMEAISIPAVAALTLAAQLGNRRPKGHDVGDKAGSTGVLY
jgi:hypothetical protein